MFCCVCCGQCTMYFVVINVIFFLYNSSSQCIFCNSAFCTVNEGTFIMLMFNIATVIIFCCSLLLVPWVFFNVLVSFHGIYILMVHISHWEHFVLLSSLCSYMTCIYHSCQRRVWGLLLPNFFGSKFVSINNILAYFLSMLLSLKSF